MLASFDRLFLTLDVNDERVGLILEQIDGGPLLSTRMTQHACSSWPGIKVVWCLCKPLDSGAQPPRALVQQFLTGPYR